jgi:hypothetical protein
MSEYQYVAFRAIDAPVNEKNLAYMQKQSSRAEITEWSFDNEYNFGDFGGDATEMLRRGYDIHIHYANYGIRTLMLRLPTGWPDPNAVKPYLNEDRIKFQKDSNGPGGVLELSPFYEVDSLDELWDIEEWIDNLAPLRTEILDGDLRPLYLMHLAACLDDEHDPEETQEAPVPAGLDRLTDAQQALADFYEIPESLLQTAAQGAPLLTQGTGPQDGLENWVHAQPNVKKDEWLSELLNDPHGTRSAIKTAYRAACPAAAWPTQATNRTIKDLQTAADQLEKAKKPKAKAAKKSRKS